MAAAARHSTARSSGSFLTDLSGIHSTLPFARMIRDSEHSPR